MMINLTKLIITEDIAIKQVASYHNRLFQIIFLVKCLYSQVNRVWRPSVCCWLTRSSILRTSSCCEETTSVLPSTESTDFMMNVSLHLNLLISCYPMIFRQKKVQYQAVEDIHRLFQLSPHRRDCWREDLLLSRGTESRPAEHGADQEDHETYRRPWHRWDSRGDNWPLHSWKSYWHDIMNLAFPPLSDIETQFPFFVGFKDLTY